MAEIEIPGAPAGPGTHALVIGVSSYPFADGAEASDLGRSFGLRSLTSAARSASEVAQWLLTEYHNPDVPLASMQVLLSPAEGEELAPEIAARLDAPAPATRAAVEEAVRTFRDRCRGDVEGIAFVYVAGHGVQLTSRGAVVLLEDFGDPQHLTELEGAIDVVACHDGFEDSSLCQRQVWFCDACRQVPEVARRFEVLEGAMRLSRPVGSVRATPLFLASSSRESAFADVGGTSIFCQALLWALRGAAASGPDAQCNQWHVRVTELIHRVPQRVSELVAEHGELQNVDIGGRPLDMVLQRFQGPPVVSLDLTIQPEDRLPVPTAALLDLSRPPGAPVDVPTGWPLHLEAPAGMYRLVVEAPPGAPVESYFMLQPPGYASTVEVT